MVSFPWQSWAEGRKEEGRMEGTILVKVFPHYSSADYERAGASGTWRCSVWAHTRWCLLPSRLPAASGTAAIAVRPVRGCVGVVAAPRSKRIREVAPPRGSGSICERERARVVLVVAAARRRRTRVGGK